MAGPLIEAVKDKLGVEEDLAERVAEESPLVAEYQEELGRRVPDAGGCCSAAEVAEQMRSQRYD